MSLIKANAHQVGDYTLTNEGGKLVINQGTPDTVLNPVGVFGLNGLEVEGGTVQDVLDAVTGPTGAATVGYTPDGTGAVATTVQEKLREIVSVADKGADGVGYDSAEIAAAASTEYATVQRQHLVSFSNISGFPSKGLIGTSPSAELNNPSSDQATVAVFSSNYQRPNRAKIYDLSITGSNSDLTNNYPDLSTWSSYSHYIGNYIHDVSCGIAVSYNGEDSANATAAFGGTISQFSSNTPVAQPLRASRGVTVAFNDIVNANIIGQQIFCTDHTRVIGNSVVNDTPSSQHGYRFTGYPGGPTNFNAAAANTAKNVQNGLSVQTATRYNSFSGFVTESPTIAGLNLNVNDALADWHHSCNYFQGISKGGTHGVYAAKPQHNHIQHIIDGATTWGVHFDAGGTHGLNAGNLLDAVIVNSAEGANINSSNNHVRVVLSQINGRGITIAGSYNIVDVICDTPSKTTATVSLQISGSYNQVRLAAVGNSAASDVSISGSGNFVQLISAKSIGTSGNDNTFVGAFNTGVGGATISNTGARNDFSGLKGISGKYAVSGTTNASGEFFAQHKDRNNNPIYRPDAGSAFTYYASAIITNMATDGTAGKTVSYKNTTNTSGFTFVVYNADGTVAANQAVTLVVDFGVPIF